MKFKVGDIIKGTKDGRYAVTNEDMYAARVIELYKSGNIRIRILDHLVRDNVGDTYIVNPKHFVYKDNDSKDNFKDNNTYKNNLVTNRIVKIIEAPYGARGVNETYGILIDAKTADKIFEEETFCHQGLGKNSDYFFIPFNSKFYDTQHYSSEIWGLGKNFEEIVFKDITTGTIYNIDSIHKKMTIEEIEKELGYKIELIQ